MLPRFKPLDAFVEGPSSYVPGGFHPVHLGDMLGGRYKIVRKLGFGVFSTVWLALDTAYRSTNTSTSKTHYVALKVCAASHSSRQDFELAQLSSSSRLEEQARSPEHHTGPNGSHLLVPAEPLGRSFQTLLDLTRFAQPHQTSAYGFKTHWPASFVREACRQVVTAVADLHARGFIHRDLKPDNLLLALAEGLDGKSEEEVLADVRAEEERSGEGKVHVLEVESGGEGSGEGTGASVEGEDGHSPRYLVEPSPLDDGTVLSFPPAFRAVLTDFSAACRVTDANDGKHAHANAYRPPELVLGLPLSAASDVWALGCLLFELATCDPLLSTTVYEDDSEETDDELLVSMVRRLGAMPRELREKWERWAEYVDDGGKLIVQAEIPIAEKGDERKLRWYGDLEVGVKYGRPVDMSGKQAEAFREVLRACLSWSSQERKSAEDVLDMRWFRDKW